MHYQTMQIARQVYGINTAENAMIFFKDCSPAYLTKRFDAKEEARLRETKKNIFGQLNFMKHKMNPRT